MVPMRGYNKMFPVVVAKSRYSLAHVLAGKLEQDTMKPCIYYLHYNSINSSNEPMDTTVLNSKEAYHHYFLYFDMLP